MVSSRRGSVGVIGALLLLAAGAWVATGVQMAGMDAGPGTDPGAFGFYISSWVVMMAAMMLPSVAPAAVAFRRLGRAAVFVCGYLAVWGASGAVGYAILKLGRVAAGDLFAWSDAGRWTAAAVLLVAALYEFTPAKGRCLTRCRAPHLPSPHGPFLTGIEQGAWCLGCCWALMAALFALGAMSLTWMLVIAALISAEKLLPWRTAATVSVAVVLAALAIGVAAAPHRVPGLTVPSKAMSSMSMMR